MAETVRRGVRNLAISHTASAVAAHVTLSLGVFSAMPTSDEHNSDWYVIEADRRLYNAKQAGRDRCVCN
jgi:diguanylate cyclase (GGDEF)-like protein